MNDAIFWRLVWKEYRTQRAFWFVMVGAVVGLQWAVRTTFGSEPGVISRLATIAIMFPLFYALGCGACLFAMEKEEGTFELLRSLPLSAGRLLAAKLLPAVAGLVLLLGLGWLTYHMLAPSSALQAWDRSAPPEWNRIDFALILLISLECLAWGVFFSLIFRRVMYAVLVGVIPMLLLYMVSRLSYATWNDSLTTQPSFFWSAGYRIQLVVLLVAIYVLARAWIARPAFEWRRLLADVATHDLLAGVWRFEVARHPVLRHFLRLVWLERRNTRVAASLLIPFVILWVVVEFFGVLNIHVHESLVILSFTWIPLLLGIGTFRTEQRGRQFRFLADRGISARLIWSSKQVIWLGLAIGLLAIWLATLYVFAYVRNDALVRSGRLGHELMAALFRREVPADALLQPRIHSFRVDLLTACFCYAVGQFASLLFSRTLIALGVGCLLMYVILIWQTLMFALGVPYGFSVAPIPIVLMVATYLRAPNWLRERNDWRAWAPASATIAIPAFVVLIAVAAYRLYEIPVYFPTPTREIARYAVGPLDSRFATAARLVSPMNFKDDPQSLDDTVVKGWESATPEQREWLQQNLAVLRALNSKPDEAPAAPGAIPGAESLRRLGILLLFSARQHEAAKQFTQAGGDYQEALRLSAFMPEEQKPDIQLVMGSLRSTIYRFLPGWAAAPGQSAATIRGGIFGLLAHQRTLLPPTKSPAFVVRKPDLPGALLMWKYLPWERWRAERLLPLLNQAAESRREHVESVLRQDGVGLIRWDRDNSFASGTALLERPFEWIRTTAFIEHVDKQYSSFDPYIVEEAKRRAAMIQLALVAWEWEHRKLPPRLSDLNSGSFRVTVNPWTGFDFGYEPRNQGTIDVPRNSAAGRLRGPFLWCILPNSRRAGPERWSIAKYDFEQSAKLPGTELAIFPIPIVANSLQIKDPEQALRVIRDSLDRRWKRLNPIRLKYRVNSYRRGDYHAFFHPPNALLTMMGPHPAVGGATTPKPAGAAVASVQLFGERGAIQPDERFVAEYDWSRKAERTRHALTPQALVEGKFVAQGEPALNIYDGKQAILSLNRNPRNGGAREFETSTDPASVVGFAEFPFHLTLENELRLTLKRTPLAEATSSIEFEWEQVGEKTLAVLTFRQTSGVQREKIWLSPELGYAVVKQESDAGFGRLRRRSEAEYQATNELAIPKQVVLTSFRESDQAVTEEIRAELISVITDPNEIPDEIFEVTVPATLPVEDKKAPKEAVPDSTNP